VRAMAGEQMENVYAVTPVALVTQDKAFSEAFEVEFEKKPDFIAPFGYDIMNMLEMLPLELVQETLLEETFVGINGDLTFNEHGEIEFPLVVVSAQDQEIVFD
jgi:hypothetical protein